MKERGITNMVYRGLRRILLFFWSHRLTYGFYKYVFGSVVRNINGYKLYLNLKDDTGIAKELFTYRKREHFSTDFLMESKEILQSGDVVLDIGANIGYYALLESKKIGDSGHVYAIEPVSSNFKSLKKNILLNNAQNTTTYQMAVGNESGEMTVHIHEKGNWSSLARRDIEGYIGEEKIKVTRIDNFLDEIKEVPALIRMDVEGYEWAILEGMGKYAEKSIPLLIEIHPHILTDEQKDVISIFLKKYYTSVLAIRDINPVYLNRQSKIRPILKMLDKKIGQSGIKEGSVAIGINQMGVDELCVHMYKQRQAIHALIR